MPDPPEVLFDRCIRRLRSNSPVRPDDPDSRPYKGKKDLCSLPADVETLLTSVQRAFNEALSNETHVADHAPHSPFHFDYIESTSRNALAFRDENYSFIGITIELVYLLWDICFRLAKSEAVKAALGLETELPAEPLHVVLLRIQLFFIVAHEYTHHIHGHFAESVIGHQILDTSESGTLEEQMMEAAADGYSTYYVLTHLFTEGREHAISLLNIGRAVTTTQDEVLLTCFVAATGAYFLSSQPTVFDGVSLYKLRHPPQAARMNLLMQQAISWCKQNRSALVEWMSLQRFQSLMNAIEAATWGLNGGKDWSEQTAFFSSEAGHEYFSRLDKLMKKYVAGPGFTLDRGA